MGVSEAPRIENGRKAMNRTRSLPIGTTLFAYTTETYGGKRVQKSVYKGIGPVPVKNQGVVWPKR